MGDEEFEGVGVVALFHLGVAFPLGFGLVIEHEVTVVVGRFGIFDPEVAAGDLTIRKFGVFFDCLGVTPGSTDVEYSGG